MISVQRQFGTCVWTLENSYVLCNNQVRSLIEFGLHQPWSLSRVTRTPAIYYILLAFAVGYAVGRIRSSSAKKTFQLQNRGEALVSRALRLHFFAPDFHLLNHITLKLEDGTTQIDHILVSRFGVFVIETKDYSGWIFADAKHEKWTQVKWRRKSRFQNPIFQNARHVRAVRSLLDFLSPGSVKSIVVFAGSAQFKTDMPPGVFTLPGLIEHLRGASVEILSLNRVQFCVGRLETARLAISETTDLEHIENLRQRHGTLN